MDEFVQNGTDQVKVQAEALPNRKFPSLPEEVEEMILLILSEQGIDVDDFVARLSHFENQIKHKWEVYSLINEQHACEEVQICVDSFIRTYIVRKRLEGMLEVEDDRTTVMGTIIGRSEEWGYRELMNAVS